MDYEEKITIDNYFFEADGAGNIYIYKESTMELLDIIPGINRCDCYEFLENCREWLRKKDEKI